MVIVNCGGNAIDIAIKTINNVTLKGTGNITLADLGAQPSLVSGTNIKTVHGVSILGSGEVLSADDIAALTSGINATKVGNYDAYATNKQDTLVSGTNIKTVNGNSLLGSGDVTLSDLGTRWTTANVSIATTDWSATTGGYQASVTVTGLTTTSLVVFPEVIGYPTMRATGQASNSLTVFCDVTPTEAVSVSIGFTIAGLE